MWFGLGNRLSWLLVLLLVMQLGFGVLKGVDPVSGQGSQVTGKSVALAAPQPLDVVGWHWPDWLTWFESQLEGLEAEMRWTQQPKARAGWQRAQFHWEFAQEADWRRYWHRLMLDRQKEGAWRVIGCQLKPWQSRGVSLICELELAQG
jgi:hypothetical protein